MKRSSLRKHQAPGTLATQSFVDIARSWILPACVCFVLFAIPTLYAERLPDSLAIHWDTSDQPTTPIPGNLYFFAFVTAWIFCWVCLMHFDMSARRERRSPLHTSLFYFAGGMLISAHMLIIGRNLDAITWRDAKYLDSERVLLALIAAGFFGLIGHELEQRNNYAPRTHPGTPQESPPLLLPERTSQWVFTASNGWLTAGGATASGISFGAVLHSNISPSIACLSGIVAFGASMVFSTVCLTINRQEILTTIGPWALTRNRLRLEDLEEARVLFVRPLRRTQQKKPRKYRAPRGWGYRETAQGGWILIMRRGAALGISAKDGRSFLVTIDNAGLAASVLNALMKKSSGETEDPDHLTPANENSPRTNHF